MLVLLVGQSAFAADKDPCASPDPFDRSISLVLKSARVQGDAFYGVFELENRNLSSPIALSGSKSAEGFRIGHPEVTVEFKDLVSNWVPLPALPGTFSKPDQLAIQPNSKNTFTVFLMSRETANLSASDFRLLVRSFSPRLCVVSTPFRAVPARTPVEGFDSSSLGPGANKK